MTFVLVSVVYAVAVSKPGFGNIGPLAVVRRRQGAATARRCSCQRSGRPGAARA